MNSAILLGALGGLLGVLGGAAGTYFSIRNTKTPDERRFMVRAAIGIWFGVLLFLAALFLTPGPWRGMLWLCYGIVFPVILRRLNRRHSKVCGLAVQRL